MPITDGKDEVLLKTGFDKAGGMFRSNRAHHLLIFLSRSRSVIWLPAIPARVQQVSLQPVEHVCVSERKEPNEERKNMANDDTEHAVTQLKTSRYTYVQTTFILLVQFIYLV